MQGCASAAFYCAGGFYSLCAALALYMFFWQFPSPGTPLFLADEGPVAVLLKQARGGGMVLAGEDASCSSRKREAGVNSVLHHVQYLQ
jgi:hypothetical protein